MDVLEAAVIFLFINIGVNAIVIEEVVKRDIGVDESDMCERFMGANYPYICSSDSICLLCPDKAVGDGKCQVCNGNKDCPGGEDERGCAVRTKPYKGVTCSNPDYPYSCATPEPTGGTKCLSKQQICDALWDCSDESDENGCDYSEHYGTANNRCPVPSQKKLGGRGVAKFNAQMLEAHNYFRCLHDSDAMTLSAKMKKQAKTSVDTSAATGGLKHSFKGENLALIQIPISDATGFGITKMWYDEIKDYNYDDFKKSTGVVGHFTQVVWADSSKLGCASTVDIKGNTQVACEYDPPGNYATVEDHVDNVNRPIS